MYTLRRYSQDKATAKGFNISQTYITYTLYGTGIEKCNIHLTSHNNGYLLNIKNIMRYICVKYFIVLIIWC